MSSDANVHAPASATRKTEVEMSESSSQAITKSVDGPNQRATINSEKDVEMASPTAQEIKLGPEPNKVETEVNVDASASATRGTEQPESELDSSRAHPLEGTVPNEAVEERVEKNTAQEHELGPEPNKVEMINPKINVDVPDRQETEPVERTNQRATVTEDIDVEAPGCSQAQNATVDTATDADAPGPATDATKSEPGPSLSQAHPLIMETISGPDTTEISEASREALDQYLSFLHESSILFGTESPEEQVQMCLEDIILRKARDSGSAKSSKIDMATATEAEKAADRRRILDALTTKHRFIFQSWPRDPKGGWIKQDGPERVGKQTSNRSDIWGATLFDFYTVYRYPENTGLLTLSCGSRLAAWMKKHGETYAPGPLQAAEEEAHPYLMKPYDIGVLIMDQEKQLRSKSWAKWHNTGKAGKGRAREDWELPNNWPPKSPFDPRAYPAPWPQEPFVYGSLFHKPPNLQAYIPPSRLPAKLIVHDPAKLLKAVGHKEQNDNPTIQNITQDITHVYRLTKSTQHTARADSDEAELAAQEAERLRVRTEFLKSPSSNKAMPSGIVLDSHSLGGNVSLGPCKPPIFIVFPHLPEREQPPEAHLYLSPQATIGTGGHSYVYRAELEVPRSYLVDEVMCPQCVLEDLQKILAEQDGARGEKRDRRWDFPSGRHELKAKTKMGVTVVMKDANGVERERFARRPEDVPEVVYEGPYRAIETRVKYQDLALGSYCEHLKTKVHPLTSKVCVAAKLSIAGDAHLAREAENYQAFPRHFFEHWSGYNIVYPLHDPVPVTPVVPQYYGYYVVEKDSSKPSAPNDKGKQKESDDSGSDDAKEEDDEYLSPIMLLEDCGKMINPDELSIDDKQECAALLYRFHEADWVHNSVARRNVVRQPGSLTASPQERRDNMSKRGGYGTDWSYRLIDFGRSIKIAAEDPGMPIIVERGTMQNWTMGIAGLQ